MGECEGCGKLGRMVPRDDFVDAYHFSLLLSPVVSVWDCIVRKMSSKQRLKKDSDDSCKILLNKEEVFNTWSCDGNIDLLGCEKKPSLPHEDCSGNSFERIGWVPNTCGTGCQWGERETNDLSFSYESLRGGVPVQYFDDGSWGTTEFSAGLIAAQAVSSLQIAEDAHGDTFLFDGMLRG
ncbi:hypothetical protein DKX38_008824 [Salix brachista]|uniref:Uncharacterized protein n=2 Tax=Salix TaxID=40685 RepID=A0A5N5MB44_9ROSI|nr:hypothetical protein DKX38_008824 [Salix brachista]